MTTQMGGQKTSIDALLDQIEDCMEDHENKWVFDRTRAYEIIENFVMSHQSGKAA
jgi:hypothetical protein